MLVRDHNSLIKLTRISKCVLNSKLLTELMVPYTHCGISLTFPFALHLLRTSL